jgi:hypothetical protein
MAAKTWEADFRYPAIQASRTVLGRLREDEDMFNLPASFCVPVAEKPVVGWTPGRMMLIALVMGFLLLGSGVFLATVAEKKMDDAAKAGVMTLAVCCTLSGILMFFLPVVCDRYIMCWLIGDRGRKLFERAGTTKILTTELSNADRSATKISIDGDDYVLIFPDDVNRRLLIEGIGARYQIRSEDVEQLLPFQFMNYLGVEIVCRIGTEGTLRIALARVSILLEMTRQIPILFFLRGRISNTLLIRISEVFGTMPTQ